MIKDTSGKIAVLQQRRLAMVTYLKLKTEQEDWHGVADAAMDIREIDAALKTLQEITE